MASQRGKFVRSLVLIVILIGGLWGGGVYGHSREVADAEKECKARQPGASASPSPSVSPTSSPSPTGSPSARPSPTASPKANAKSVECDDPTLIRLGLDLQGGISVVLAPSDPNATVDAGSLIKARDIIAQRVDALGVAEPDITVQGSNILVQLPGIKDQRKALDLIGTVAKLSFRPVLGVVNPGSLPAGLKAPNCADPSTYPRDDPAKELLMCVHLRNPQTGVDLPREQWALMHLGKVALSGEDVSGADASLPAEGLGAWLVELRLTKEGDRRFADITGKLACNREQSPRDQLAIVLDSVVESHPAMGEQVQCNQGISGGTAQITGDFSEQEAKDLALVLRYGALPIELEPLTTTTVSPTLGRDSLRGGLYAGAIGLGVVLLYVLLFYRALGVIIWIGIALHGVLTLGVVVVLGQTAGFALSLAGIAGLIVSLGIAADSFIVYFERIKDEVHQGKTVRASVDRAWASAWRTILAADLVTALAAVVLYFLAVGSVRGFALTLGLATALDVFVSRWFMHPAVWLLAQGKLLGGSKTLGMGGVAGGGAPVIAGGAR